MSRKTKVYPFGPPTNGGQLSSSLKETLEPTLIKEGGYGVAGLHGTPTELRYPSEKEVMGRDRRTRFG
ncbi:MAG: hypothetical protein IPK61_07995 [Saprospiraceae bacterium]|nr:hypothetical protein [Saprospiraceae bacterium]